MNAAKAGVEVVVRSAGAVLPAAGSAAELLQLAAGAAPERRIGLQVPMPDLQAAAGVAMREVRKLDRFSLLALAAARRALAEAAMPAAEQAACGVITGNVFAGWTFTEPQLAALHRDGPEAVSPYLATAWFPAAPQGQITIQLGLQGYAKTITTDRCAGSQAIGLAYERIAAGRSGPLLAGGVEAPLTPLVEEATRTWGSAAEAICEGAAYLLLAAAPPADAAGAETPAGSARGGRLRIAAYDSHPLPAALAAAPLPIHDAAAAWLAVRLQRFAATFPSPRVVVLNFPLDEPLVAAARRALATVWPGAGAAALAITPRLGDALAASGAVAAIVAGEALAATPDGNGTALVVTWGHQGCDLLALRLDP